MTRAQKKKLEAGIEAARKLAEKMTVVVPPEPPTGPSVWVSLVFDEKSGRWSSPLVPETRDDEQ